MASTFEKKTQDTPMTFGFFSLGASLERNRKIISFSTRLVLGSVTYVFFFLLSARYEKSTPIPSAAQWESLQFFSFETLTYLRLFLDQTFQHVCNIFDLETFSASQIFRLVLLLLFGSLCGKTIHHLLLLLLLRFPTHIFLRFYLLFTREKTSNGTLDKFYTLRKISSLVYRFNRFYLAEKIQSNLFSLSIYVTI